MEYFSENTSRNRRKLNKKREIVLTRTILAVIGLSVVCTLIIGIVIKIFRQNKAGAVPVNISEETTENTGKVNEETVMKAQNPTYEVKAPKDYSRNEMIKILKQYAEWDMNIKYIYDNINDYDTDLLDKVVNNPEMAEFIRNYYEYDENISDELTQKEKGKAHPLFKQWDERWGHVLYGDSNIGLAGCGPTCLAMVVFSLTRNEQVTPLTVAEYSENHGYYVEGVGTAWSLMTTFPSEYNVGVHEINLSEENMKNELDCGKMIICGMGPGDFTRNGHFIVIYGYDRKGFKVNDPNCIARSKRRWSYDRLCTQIKVIWSYEMNMKEEAVN